MLIELNYMQLEDALRQFVKDLRRDGRTVSRYSIVADAKWLMPEALEERGIEACLVWCSRLLQRSGLTRRVTQSGRNAKAELESLRIQFAEEVARVVTENLLDPHRGLAPRRLIFNMDQTAMFASAGVLTTIEVRGARTARSSSGLGRL